MAIGLPANVVLPVASGVLRRMNAIVRLRLRHARMARFVPTLTGHNFSYYPMEIPDANVG